MDPNPPMAYVAINIELGSREKIMKELEGFTMEKDGGIIKPHLTYGTYNIIGEVYAENEKEMENFIELKIRKIYDVRSTLTLKSIKNEEWHFKE